MTQRCWRIQQLTFWFTLLVMTDELFSMRLSTACAAPLVTLKLLPSGAFTVASVLCMNIHSNHTQLFHVRECS